MCGIAGIWSSSKRDPASIVSSMLDAMEHRGPDGRGTLEYPGGAAGMVRLALVDLSPRGQQPLWSADRRVAIVFNGEMYNFREERARLKAAGHTFQSETDTEVVLRLYLERGTSFHERVRGMYALAILDWREGGSDSAPTLLLARDPLGIKPLYVAGSCGSAQGLMFSSELRALLASGLVRPDVSTTALAGYLARGFVLQPETLVSGVRMIEPGTHELYAPGQPVVRKQFWRVPPARPETETLEEAAARLRALLEESVRLHALADAPIGAFLSGGIDSTGIVALMRPHIADLRTYTVRFPDLPGEDEADLAAEAARQYECRHTTVEVTSRDIRAMLPRFAGDLDQPSADGLNTWLVSDAAARDVKGVLSGLGGDEWFAGYPVVRRMVQRFGPGRRRGPILAGHVAHQLAPWLPVERLRNRAQYEAARRSPLATWIQAHTVFPDDMARRLAGLVSNGRSHAAAISDWLERDGPWRGETMVGLSNRLDARVYMTSQLLRDSDATSMAHSLELRVPLVDQRLAEFSRSCADPFKVSPGGGTSNVYGDSGAKRVLIEALGDLLPADIGRRSKKGFTLPFEHWMRGEVSGLVDDTCGPDALERRGLLDPGMVAHLRRRGRSGRRGTLYPSVWTLMIFELWCRAVLDPVTTRRSS